MDKKILTHKKPWQKPELIVLVRSNPEEAVLTACKNTGAETGAVAINKKCNTILCRGKCNAQSST